MLLIVDSNVLNQVCYKNYLATRRMFEGIDFVFADSYRAAGQAFNTYEENITEMIVNHSLIGEETGADVVKKVCAKERDSIRIVRCSDQQHFNKYPRRIPWFPSSEGVRAPINFLLGE